MLFDEVFIFSNSFDVWSWPAGNGSAQVLSTPRLEFAQYLVPDPAMLFRV